MSDLGVVEVDDDDGQPAAGFDARRLAELVVIAGLVVGVAAAGFLLWEAWTANRDALEHNRRAGEEAQIFSFADGPDSPPPAAGPPAGPGDQESYPAG